MKILISILTILSLASCSAKIKNFSKYQKSFLSKSAFLPDKEDLKNKNPKLVIFEFEENDNEVAKNSNLGKSLANEIENVISKDQLAQLVDRKAANKLQKEIALIEMNKTGSYSGPLIADYAISGAIGDASFTSKYSSGGIIVNPKNYTVVKIPPSYKYKADISGNIKIYELPSLKIINVIEIKGKATRSENVRQNGGLDLGIFQVGGKSVNNLTRDDALVRKAGQNAIELSQVKIKNALSKKGYILEKKVFKKNAIFRINIGSNDGIKEGDLVEIIAKRETQNAITDEMETEKSIIAKGKISNIINSKSSWIILNEQDSANIIKLGDIAKIKYTENKFLIFIKKFLM